VSGSGRPIRFTNVALWDDVEAHRAVFRDVTPAGQRVPGVTGYPGLFRVFVDVDPAPGS
jgi:hypothetical protein